MMRAVADRSPPTEGSFGVSRFEVAPRQRSSTAETKCMSWPAETDGTDAMVASLRGNWGTGTSLQDTRGGAVVGKPHRKQRVALGDNGGVEFCRTLGDEAEKDAVFAALLGDARN